jgi:cell surface protein SprA
LLKDKNKFRLLLLIFVVTCIALLSSSKSYSQGRDRSKFQFLNDTTFSGTDTSKIIDTTLTKKEPVDSTARIKYFKYQRQDSYLPKIAEYRSPLLLYGVSNTEYRVSFEALDSVTITQYINGEEAKVPAKIPFNEYVKLRSQLSLKNQLYSIVAEKYKIETGDELEQLFKNITDITIPLPFATETIFGPPTINLKINGLIDITASYQETKSDQPTILQPDQSQNNINFKQEVQVTTKGSIGDKLTIDADWNSQRTFDYENQLKLKYQGYPDEVIQRIEAGNVSLETKSNLIGSTQALFGVKGQFQLGPLTLTAIASQKKSEKKEVNITGGSQEITFEIPAYQYSDNHFFLDIFYFENYEEFYKFGSLRSNAAIARQVSPDIEVWAQTTASNPNKRYAVCWIDLEQKPANGNYAPKWTNRDTVAEGYKTQGYFYKLNPGDYTLNDQAGYISININTLPSPNDAIAVAYRFANNNSVQYGTYSNDQGVGRDSLVLKLVRYPGLLPPSVDTAYRKAWIHKIKSIYSVGVRNIKNDANKFQFDVYYKPASGVKLSSLDNKTFLNRTKLDIRNTGSYAITGGDGQFDFFPGYTVDLTAGEVIFPTLSPFFQTLKDSIPNTPPLPDSMVSQDSAIYFFSKADVQSQSSPVKFYMGGTATGDASSRYSLGFNVVEGSVKVFNGSVQLTQGVDYTVDYSTGELVIRNASVLTAGANLKITYETNDLFQLASKTLLGARAEYQINKSSYAGFTLLNLKQQTLNDKVRIGEEPTNNTILGFDASTDIKTNFLTNLINKIPGYKTKEESLLSLKSEVAFMIPDPNTKKSLIPSDNGEAVAYIDDFEGTKKLISLGLNPLSWIVSSIPKDSLIYPWQRADSDSMMSIRRCRLQWFNLINNVDVKEVYPNRELGNSQNRSLTPLVFQVIPDQTGMFGYIKSQDFRSLDGGDRRKKWTGVFKYLNTSQTNLLDENMGFIQIWMQINNNKPLNDSAKMIIDLGIITEKVISSKRVPTQTEKGVNYHTEDLNNNGTLDDNEDVGLDGIPSISSPVEQQKFPDLGSDPSGDNFTWTQGSEDYSSFNGTEGNSNLTEGKRIDTEDLNGNGNLDEIDNFFRYELPLSGDTNKYVTGRGNNGWRQYSIPLNDFVKIFGSASLTNVQYMRVWFKGITKDTATLKIVDFNIVGNQWQKTNKGDSSYSIAVVNIEENYDIYRSPVTGDILRQTNQTSIDNGVLQNEQSMSLEVRNLVQGPGKFAYKFFNSIPVDLLNYKILKLFINGDPSFKYTDTSNYDAAVVVRLGSDSLNYYEYKAPLHPDGRPSTPWNPFNEISISLTDLTQVKQLRDSVGNLVYFPVPNGPPGSKYGVIGNPTITSITQIALGVVNNKNSIVSSPLTGSVWFNEMRVLKTNDKSGYAYTMSAGLKIADLGTLNFSYSKVDPNFHALEGRFGNRILSNNWDFSGTLNLHKIINSLLASAISIKLKDFFTIPISFSHSEVYDQPVYLPGTDIDLETAVQNKYNAVMQQLPNNPSFAEYSANQIRIASQTLRIINRFSVNGFKFTFPSDNFFAKEILNKMEISFYRNSVTERNPLSESKYSWDMGGSLGLTSNLNLLDALHLNIGKLIPLGDDYKEAKLYFFFPFIGLSPLFSSSIGAATNFTRNRGDEKLRNQVFPNPTSRNFNANRNISLDWKFIENWIVDIGGNYSFTAGSDLTYLETTNDSLKKQRSEGEIFRDIFFHNALVNFGKDLSYNQAVSIDPKFNIPGIKQFLDLTSSYRVQYLWQPSLQAVNVGSTVGYTADFQTSAALRLNRIYDLFKSTNNPIQGGAQTQDTGQKQSLGELLKFLRGFLPDQLNVTYSQQKGLSNGGVTGRPGFANFWVMLGTKEQYGPSRLYQLGWTNYPGKRVPFVQLSDAESYSNTVNFSTFITPVFPNNLKISFTYKTSWSNNKQLSYITNEAGDIGLPTSVYSVKTISRPTFLFSGDLVSKLAKPDISSTTQAKEISDSFDKNIVSFPFPGWNLTLSGIEKFEMFSGFASSISFENAYSSDYKKTIKLSGGMGETVDQQSLTSGFTPLIGINVTFKQVEGGNLTASFKLNKTNNYELTPSSLLVNNTATNDLSINASYTKQGFKIPLFGLSLDNDLSIAFSYTRTTNDPRTIKYELGIWNDNAQNGSISTTLNPSIQYALSRSVTVQLFYKFTKIGPSVGSNQIPTRTSNEAGLNLKLSIQ